MARPPRAVQLGLTATAVDLLQLGDDSGSSGLHHRPVAPPGQRPTSATGARLRRSSSVGGGGAPSSPPRVDPPGASGTTSNGVAPAPTAIAAAKGGDDAGICISGPSAQHAAARTAETDAAAAAASSLRKLGLGVEELNELPPGAAAVLYRTLDAASAGVQELLSGRPLTRGGVSGTSSASVQQQLAELSYRPPTSANRRPPTAPGSVARPGSCGGAAGASRLPIGAGGTVVGTAGGTDSDVRRSMSLAEMLALTSSTRQLGTAGGTVGGTSGGGGTSASAGGWNSGGAAPAGGSAEQGALNAGGRGSRGASSSGGGDEGLQGMSAITFPLASGVRAMLRRGSPAASRRASGSGEGTEKGGGSGGGVGGGGDTMGEPPGSAGSTRGGSGAAVSTSGGAGQGHAVLKDVVSEVQRTAGDRSVGRPAASAMRTHEGGEDSQLEVVKRLLLSRNPGLLHCLDDALVDGGGEGEMSSDGDEDR